MTKASSVSAFYEVLSEHDSFKVFVTEWRQHKALEEQIREFLPFNLKEKIKLGCLKKGVVYLVAENNSIATQGRYHLPNLLSHLRKLPGWAGLGSVQIRVETEFFTEGQLLRTNTTQHLATAQLVALIHSYGKHSTSPEQKAACEAWIKNLQAKET